MLAYYKTITYITCIVSGKSCTTLRNIRFFCVTYKFTTARVVRNTSLEDIALVRLGIECKPGALSAVKLLAKPLAFFYTGNLTNSLE